MTEKWKKLAVPPVTVTFFQIKFDESSVKAEDFLQFDEQLKRIFKKRSENIHTNISFDTSTVFPIGKSQISGVTDTRRTGYLYYTVDQKKKFSISDGNITYSSEGFYEGWEVFKKEILKVLVILTPVMNQTKITRTSIRFINQFNLPDFDEPAKYFNTLVTASEEVSYPLLKYGFKLTFDVKPGIYSIVNQNAEKVNEKYLYIFDIDVLNLNNYIFDTDFISETLEELRETKNTIFFGNVTEKTLELCN